MTLYIAKRQLGLNPLAIFIDNGFSLTQMYENAKRATDILGIDLEIFKTADLLKVFPLLIRSKKPIYYCRVCHAVIDNMVRSIANKNSIELILGGYTKGQQYIRNSELFWIYQESDKNVIEVLSKEKGFEELIALLSNQNKYFRENYGNIRLLSPFKYLEWDEDEIIRIITNELEFELPQNSWPDKSSNCMFNFVSQYLVEKIFGYAQHEVELSELIREGELSRSRALEVIETPIEEKYMIEPIEKIGVTMEDIYYYDKRRNEI